MRILRKKAVKTRDFGATEPKTWTINGTLSNNHLRRFQNTFIVLAQRASRPDVIIVDLRACAQPGQGQLMLLITGLNERFERDGWQPFQVLE